MVRKHCQEWDNSIFSLFNSVFEAFLPRVIKNQGCDKQLSIQLASDYESNTFSGNNHYPWHFEKVMKFWRTFLLLINLFMFENHRQETN